MANIAYELAMRFGTAAYMLSQTKRHAEEPAEREMARERTRPLPPLDLPEGRAVYWLHAVSLGEANVASVLVRELKKQAPDAVAVVSTSTVAGYAEAKKVEAIDAVVAARFDTRDLVSTMFEAIKPTAIILVEGDLWRNMIAMARRRNVPVYIANAKLSEKSLDFYRRFPVYSRSLFSRLARVYAQSGVYLERFALAGLPDGRGEVAGNIKLDSNLTTPPKEMLDEIAVIARCTGKSPIVTFGSLHPGEEITAIRGMQRVWENHPGAYCLIAPRHLNKTPQFIESIRSEFGLECSIYSENEKTLSEDHPEVRITIVNKIGLLTKLYALADIGVVGGTFIDSVGGHNLTEPAFMSKPVIYGPHVYKQPALHDMIAAYDAGRQTTPEAFPDVLAELIDDRELAHRLGANGRQMVEDSRGAVERVVADILHSVSHMQPQ